jgi:hypothetical protein
MFNEEIKAGAALLDENIPEWEERQDLDFLDLMESCHCVLGQSEDIRDYWYTLKKLFPHAQTDQELFDLSAEHGFSVKLADSERLTEKDSQNYDRLTREWKQLITKRREKKNVLS